MTEESPVSALVARLQKMCRYRVWDDPCPQEGRRSCDACTLADELEAACQARPEPDCQSLISKLVQERFGVYHLLRSQADRDAYNHYEHQLETLAKLAAGKDRP